MGIVGSGVVVSEGSGWGVGLGISGLGDTSGWELTSGDSMGSGVLLSGVDVGRFSTAGGATGLLSTEGCPNMGPDKSRDLSKSSKDGKDSVLAVLFLLRLVLL